MAVKDITRFESAVCALEAQTAAIGGIVLYGSSTFARFPNDILSAAFASAAVINRGFGGSTAEEALYYYPRLIAPLAPSVLVWYEGDNDPMFDYTPSRAFALSRRVWEKARADFAGCRLVLVGVKDGVGEEEANRARRAYNRRLQEYASQRSFAVYVDLPALLSGKADYAADGVHLNEAAYQKLAQAICRAVTEVTDGKL